MAGDENIDDVQKTLTADRVHVENCCQQYNNAPIQYKHTNAPKCSGQASQVAYYHVV